MKYRRIHTECVERLGRNPTPAEFADVAGIAYTTAVPLMIEFDLPKSRQPGSGNFNRKDHSGAYLALCETLGRLPTQGEFALAIGVTRQRASLLRDRFEFTPFIRVSRETKAKTIQSAAEKLRAEGKIVTIKRLAEQMGVKDEAARSLARKAGVEYRKSTRPERLEAAVALHAEMTAALGRFPTTVEFLRRWIKPGLRIEGRPDAHRYRKILGMQFSDGRKVR